MPWKIESPSETVWTPQSMAEAVQELAPEAQSHWKTWLASESFLKTPPGAEAAPTPAIASEAPAKSAFQPESPWSRSFMSRTEADPEPGLADASAWKSFLRADAPQAAVEAPVTPAPRVPVTPNLEPDEEAPWWSALFAPKARQQQAVDAETKLNPESSLYAPGEPEREIEPLWKPSPRAAVPVEPEPADQADSRPFFVPDRSIAPPSFTEALGISRSATHSDLEPEPEFYAEAQWKPGFEEQAHAHPELDETANHPGDRLSNLRNLSIVPGLRTFEKAARQGAQDAEDAPRSGSDKNEPAAPPSALAYSAEAAPATPTLVTGAPEVPPPNAETENGSGISPSDDLNVLPFWRGQDRSKG
jgi:hypothetical protein